MSENRLVPLHPMVLLIIIPMKNGYFIGNIPYFQTNPHFKRCGYQQIPPKFSNSGDRDGEESMRRGIRHPVARCVMMILQLYHRLRALWHKGCGPRCRKTSQFLSTRNPQSWLISHVMACVTLLGLNLTTSA